MRRLTWLAGLAALSAVHATSAFAAPSTVPLLDHLPVAFQANVGQHDERVEFVARGAAHTLFLTRGEAALMLRTNERAAPSPSHPFKAQRPVVARDHSVLRMRFDGGNTTGTMEGIERLPGTVNIFSGSDPRAWRRAVPQYGSVRQKSLYPGIDLLYHGEGRRLAYDFIVAPGADPTQIALAFEGIDGLALDRSGDLIILVNDVSIRHLAPIAYQEIDGTRRVIESRFALDGAGRVTFDAGTYDRTRPLVIDPTLVYATFAGGAEVDTASAIAVDAAGAVYVAGQTMSTDFPAAGTAPSTISSGDVFVAKLNAAGTALLYTTIVGGGSFDSATEVAVDSAGQIWVAALTVSSDFPTLNGFRTTFNGGGDGFVLRLDPSGALAYSTYLGAGASAIAVAPSGPGGSTQVFVTGATSSPDFPVVSAFQPTFGGAGFGDLVRGDAFVIKLDAGGNPVYATYLGGSDDDAGTSIAADAAGNAYVTGLTASVDFPVVGAIQASRAGGDTYNYDLFVAKLNRAGSALLFSTYLGGSAYELGAAFKTRLQAGDIAGALDYLSPKVQPDFDEIFRALGPDLPLVAAALGDVVAIEQVGDLAETVIVRPTNGRSNLYFIYFHRDEEGRWLIEEM